MKYYCKTKNYYLKSQSVVPVASNEPSTPLKGADASFGLIFDSIFHADSTGIRTLQTKVAANLEAITFLEKKRSS